MVLFVVVLGAHQPSDVRSPGEHGIVPGQQSRLNADFQVMEKLGEGGFAKVWKVLSLCSAQLIVMTIN